ncbi:unnamed protein product [Cuscuta europaea]|uniref:Uncharacterized protein n=1 Tax=Cuscuta europaea TaxID=41803 RepID=A0A9P1E4E3_CUSEU|nr:unnamed protein product [Cuscuta europaea]
MLFWILTIIMNIKKDDPETGEQYSALENWKDQRLTRSGEWRTKEAHEKYTQMSKEYQTHLGQTGSWSSINEIDIMNQNMKRHRGCQSGVGPTLSKGASRRMEDDTTSTFQDHRDVQISELKANQELMLRALQQSIPGFQLPPRSFANDVHSTSSANQTDQSLNEDNQD